MTMQRLVIAIHEDEDTLTITTEERLEDLSVEEIAEKQAVADVKRQEDAEKKQRDQATELARQRLTELKAKASLGPADTKALVDALDVLLGRVS